MNFYQDITLLPDADISLGFIWQKLYQQVHIALVENKIGENQSAIGVGFPEYGQKSFQLGRKLRLFAQEQAQLEKLNIAVYLTRLTDYLHLKSIQPVPEPTGYVSFVRHHAKGQARIEKDHQQKAALWASKTGKSLDECLNTLSKTKPKLYVHQPFVWIESQETKSRTPETARKFPLFIKCIEKEAVEIGAFNCYGLSHPKEQVSLPIF